MSSRVGQRTRRALSERLKYYQRIFSAYATGAKSHLTFWHGEPQVNDQFEPGRLCQYYMPFLAKADYAGHYNDQGIPMLDYRGDVGLQYNPIAVAQYGLGNYNLFRRNGEPACRRKFVTASDWLVDNLEQNPAGLWVWNHHFDWEYRDTLKAPWYSALAQGQGISLLVRAHQAVERDAYLASAQRAFETFLASVDAGGVTYVDDEGDTWFEEAIVDPPTHILNGFLWALWGVYDYFLHTDTEDARRLFAEAVETLQKNLSRFDAGFWSLYEQSGTWMKMLASPFYHRLHIVQLRVMYRLTGEPIFADYANRWNAYRCNVLKRNLALGYKALFKLIYY
jgi:heparosan-N-sulfate-glucuronate 5-epimerase